MRWPRRGILIRLFIYVPLIALLGWRAQGGCGDEAPVMEPDNQLEDKLAPHRRVIKLPDGRQQEIVELTPEEAEAILGHPIPERLDPPSAEAKGAGEGAGAPDSASEAKAEPAPTPGD